MPSEPLTLADVAAAVCSMLRLSSAEADLPPSATADAAAIVAVYLFGSCARGKATPESDVDLGLLYTAPPASTLLGQPFLLEARLAEQLGRPFQCVIMNTAPADLVHRILRDGLLLVDSNPSCRIRFEIDTRNRYFDLKPMLDRYREGKRVA